MSEARKGFYEHLREVSNPHPDGETKGTLDEFNKRTAAMAGEALRRTGAELVEYDVRDPDKARIAEIEQSVLNDPRQGEKK